MEKAWKILGAEILGRKWMAHKAWQSLALAQYGFLLDWPHVL